MQLEIDANNFLSALQDGALDVCLRYLDRQSAASRPDPLFNCKLAEALLHQRRYEEALACARRGFPEVGSDPALLHICAWVFSKIVSISAGLRVSRDRIPSSIPHCGSAAFVRVQSSVDAYPFTFYFQAVSP